MSLIFELVRCLALGRLTSNTSFVRMVAFLSFSSIYISSALSLDNLPESSLSDFYFGDPT